MEGVAGIDRGSELPLYHSKTATDLARLAPAADPAGPAFGQRKAVVYATCFVDYNAPSTATAALALLARQGVQTELVYPVCCGMPQLEAGDIAEVAERAQKVAAEMGPWIDQGYEVVALTASCGPDDEVRVAADPAGKRGGEAAVDGDARHQRICRRGGQGPRPRAGTGAGEGRRHHPSRLHARAQNMGAKSAELLRMIPETKVDLVERCSGHGGTFGVMKKTRAWR